MDGKAKYHTHGKTDKPSQGNTPPDTTKDEANKRNMGKTWHEVKGELSQESKTNKENINKPKKYLLP